MTVMTYSKSIFPRLFLSVLTLFAFLVVGGNALAASPKKMQKSFASPEEAVQALVAAVKSNDTTELLAILGPGSRKIVSSGDPVADKAGREQFTKLYDEKNAIEGADTGRAVLTMGNEAFTLPIPIVKKGNAWSFDAKAGREELLNRRIGKNELATINVLREYVDAQREYASTDWDNDGKWEFAQKFRSTPGKKDGLYWKAKEGEEESPFGALAAKAAQEGYAKANNAKQVPFHGYYFRILKAQGEHAEGGAFDYVVNGKMLLGFALIAYPAQYGASGIMSFVVNQSGVIYQKDLGRKTASIASKMKRYDPDQTWKKVE